MSNQRVLMTGAATGMGALAAIPLARSGHTVFATMRDPQGRNAAAGRRSTTPLPGLPVP